MHFSGFYVGKVTPPPETLDKAKACCALTRRDLKSHYICCKTNIAFHKKNTWQQ